MNRAWRGRRGMTLVELMVVVAILCVLLGVMSLGAMSNFHSMDSGYGMLQVPPPTLSGTTMLDAIDLDLTVRSEPSRDGWQVGTAYEVELDGEYVVRNNATATDAMRLAFTFPEGVRDLRGVHIDVRDSEGIPAQGSAQYTLGGVSWTGPMASGESWTVHLSYTASGRDTLSLALSDGRRPLQLSARVTLEGSPDVGIPSAALAPTSRTEDTLTWDLEGLLSDAPVTIELPASSSAPSHLAWVGRLAAFGVLLFGGGFWYLSEGVRPGRLDDFRLGGLLLLGLNYGLFYAIFLVLAPMSSPWVSAGVAALVSWPLLTLHVARITDRDFAVTRALPVAMASVGAVLGLAYLDQSRASVGLTVVVAITVLVTTTWRTWTAQRTMWREGETRRAALATDERALQSQTKELQRALSDADAVLADAERRLQEAPDGLGPEKAEAQRRSGRLTELLGNARASVRAGSDNPGRQLTQRIRTLDLLDRQTHALSAAVATLENAGSKAIESLFEAVGRLESALDASALVEIEVRGALGGAPERLLREVDGHSKELRTLRIEAEGLRQRISTPKGHDLRAQAAAARRLAQGLEGAMARLRTSSVTVLEAARLDGGEAAQDTVHCPACGAAHAPGSRYCHACGITRPVERPCGACGHVNRLPTHLLRTDWATANLHCGSCGAGVQAAQPNDQQPRMQSL